MRTVAHCCCAPAQEEAALEGKDLDEFHPYVVNDQGFHLRGRPFNLTVSWNVMPLVGASSARTPWLLWLCAGLGGLALQYLL
jgi:hypothetical protein